MVNRDNYHWVKKFLQYLADTVGRPKGTIDRYWFYLRHLLIWADSVPFQLAQNIQPVFKVYLNQLRIESGRNQGKPLDNQSKKKIIETSRMCLRWLKERYEDEFGDLPAWWISDLIPDPYDQSGKVHIYVTLDEILQIIRYRTDNLEIWKAQASAAMLFISGARGGAFTTLPINAINLKELEIYQWPKEFGVKTKNSISAITAILAIPEVHAFVKRWDDYLRSQVPAERWNTYPWYATLSSKWGELNLSYDEPGASRIKALNDDLLEVCNLVGVQPYSSHKFRHGHTMYGLQHCQTPEQYQAISRNLMHSIIAVTDRIYSNLELQDRKRVYQELVRNPISQPNEGLEAYFRSLSKADLALAVQIAAERMAQ
jgi:integrase